MSMADPKAPKYSYLQIGALLVKDGLISADQLVEILYEQKLLNLRLGETLLHKQLITHAQLEDYLARQALLKACLETSDKLSPVNHYYLQKILQKNISQGMTSLELGQVTDVIDRGIELLESWELLKLDHLIAMHQSSQGGKFDYSTLPNIEKQILALLRIELISPVLEEPTSYESILLGEMLISKQIITREQLQAALLEQRHTKRRLGQVLIQRKLLNFDQLDELLWEQTITKS
jgi:hypothetical protein